jgi:hypothetical protein
MNQNSGGGLGGIGSKSFDNFDKNAGLMKAFK